MTPQDTLAAAIDRAYAAFAREPRPARLIASPMRDADGILATLTAAPLRALTGEQIGPYAAWAVTTVGDARAYRHFLPRILELAVREPAWPGATPAVIADKLKRGGWHEWGDEQRAAIIDLFDAALRRDIAISPDEGGDAEAWLCGVATLGIAPEPWLAAWRDARLPGAALQIAHLVTVAMARDGSVSNGFWEGVAPTIRATVTAWLHGPATGDQLRAARALVPGEEQWIFDVTLDELGSC